MKQLLHILFLTLLCAAQGYSQTIHLHGELIYPPSDTVYITVYFDGEVIGTDHTADPFYSMILVEKPYYVIKFESDDQVKRCHLHTENIEVESVMVDVDFHSDRSSVIMKRAKRDKYYLHFKIGGGTTRETTIQIP
jgi:hypothetical protein